MNRKGFTLVELLAVLVILSAIMFIVIPSLGASMNRAKGKKIEAKKSLLVSAAEMYVSDHKYKINNLLKKVSSCYIGLDYLDQYVTDDTKKDDDGNEFTGVVQYNKDNSYNYVDSSKIDSSILYCDDALADEDEGENDEIVGSMNEPEPVNNNSGDVCSSGSIASSATKRDFKVGDYVYYTPCSTSFTTDTSMTGYNRSQTINPSELKMWRVLRINDNGTVDIISEYVSSENLFFAGQVGYQNSVGYLNTLAKQYENSTYTVGSRHFGYSGRQTENITDTSKFVVPAPWRCSTDDDGCNVVETQGGGDREYIYDYELLRNAVGTFVSKDAKTGSANRYWLASRYYDFIPYDNSPDDAFSWNARVIDENGKLRGVEVYDYGFLMHHSDAYIGINMGVQSDAIRPIVVLNSGFKCSLGVGVKSTLRNPCEIVK